MDHEALPILLRKSGPFRLPGLEPIFLRHCRTVTRKTDVTTFRRHSLSANNCRVLRCRPSVGVEQHRVTSRACATPSSFGFVP